MEWMQIGALIAMGLMAFAMWPMVKRWRENPVEAQGGFYFGSSGFVRIDVDLVGAVARPSALCFTLAFTGLFYRYLSTSAGLYRPVSVAYTLVS